MLESKKELQSDLDCNLCPKFERTFSILGKKWNGLIIETLLVNGPQRFKFIAKTIDKCSDRVLVERLRELEKDNIISRNTFKNSSLIQYELTKRGRELEPIMYEIHKWSDKWDEL